MPLVLHQIHVTYSTLQFKMVNKLKVYFPGPELITTQIKQPFCIKSQLTKIIPHKVQQIQTQNTTGLHTKQQKLNTQTQNVGIPYAQRLQFL